MTMAKEEIFSYKIRHAFVFVFYVRAVLLSQDISTKPLMAPAVHFSMKESCGLVAGAMSISGGFDGGQGPKQ